MGPGEVQPLAHRRTVRWRGVSRRSVGRPRSGTVVPSRWDPGAGRTWLVWVDRGRGLLSCSEVGRAGVAPGPGGPRTELGDRTSNGATDCARGACGTARAAPASGAVFEARSCD